MANARKIGSPLKRLPGAGLREEFENQFELGVLAPLMTAFVGVVFCVIECMHVWGSIAPSVWRGATVAVLSIVFAVWRVKKTRKALKDLRRGEKGERIVAQAIDRDLLPLGYTVFHDLLFERNGKKFNIDHLLIGPNGIFAVETKNYSKPAKGEPRVVYDGQNLTWSGRIRKNEDRQAIAAASAASEYLEEVTGAKWFVKPVLCAVGWFVTSSDIYGHPVLLVMEKTLGTVIPKAKAAKPLSKEECRMLSCRLARAIDIN